MPALGLLLGHHLAHVLGSNARPIGGGLLGLTGAYAVATGLFRPTDAGVEARTSFGQLILTGAFPALTT